MDKNAGKHPFEPSLDRKGNLDWMVTDFTAQEWEERKDWPDVPEISDEDKNLDG